MEELKKYYIKTYGCAMNYADSDRIRYILNNVGLEETKDFKTADIIILNSCSVRKQAEDKVSGWAIKIKKYGLGDKTFVLTGCMAVRFERKGSKDGLSRKYLGNLLELYPWINYIVGIEDITQLPRILNVGDFKDNNNSYLNIIPVTEVPAVANIPISTGCNFFCSYCIVPFSRGELVNRGYDEILKEVELHLNRGVKLVSLVAQNVNSWRGFKNGQKVTFADLLEDIAKLEGDFWINFVSSNPMDFTDRIVDVIFENKKIMRWLNIAVQSGSDRILKEMNRQYSVKEFEGLIEKIKKRIPDIRLTTDIIVGFPGESKDDFEKTLDLTKKLRFQMLYVGKYSPRKGTLSAKLEDNIPIVEKKRREDLLKKELNLMRKDFHNEFLGKEIDILVVGGRKGISYYYHEVLFEQTVSKNLIGSFVKGTVTDTTLSGLIAKL